MLALRSSMPYTSVRRAAAPTRSTLDSGKAVRYPFLPITAPHDSLFERVPGRIAAYCIGSGGWSHLGRLSISMFVTHLTHSKPRFPRAVRRRG